MRLFLPTLILLLMASCQRSLPDTICQAWKFDGFNISPEYEEKLASAENESAREKFRQFLKNSGSVTETNWRFYPNGTCAMLSKYHYSVKRWELNESTGQLAIINGKTREFYQIERDGTNLTLSELTNKSVTKGHVSATLRPNPEYEEGSIDLLAPTRNEWRNKPLQPESFRAIQKRLIDQLTYMIDYFELTNKKKQTYFNTGHLNSPFQFYSGGMGLFNPNELPRTWVGQFYDNGDALKAHNLLAGAFRSGLTFPHSEKTYTDAYARFLKQVKAFVLVQEEPKALPAQ
ncbi:hypothetical protein IC229_26340 [Spirosoma sp. BT702]|uniref:Uncharacterized protein n=1 Tax=Spirosoma profusum TaxID=2771354 RepID=A0A927ATR2_9BACT|nr:hypothetical protein [Spirosoma profusum]MBD2704190.1 hypothetical protein [Spirosoma profusum]